MINTELLERFKKGSPVFVAVVKTSHHSTPGKVQVTAMVRRGRITGMNPSLIEVDVGSEVVTRLPADVFLTVEEALQGKPRTEPPTPGGGMWN